MRKSHIPKNNKKIFLLLLIIILFPLHLSAADNFTKNLAGKILLQVESLGEAWYVNPLDLKRYYLGRPADAFEVMQKLSTGITNADLNKVPIGLIDYNDADSDNDGLSNRLETALGTDPKKDDTDNDGYNDKLEIENNYNPLGNGLILIDQNFTNQQTGKILLQTEKTGEAWYVSPIDLKRYYLGRPTDAFEIMRKLSLGITNNNLNNIVVGSIAPEPPSQPSPPPSQIQSASEVFFAAANAIRAKNKTLAASYFIPQMQIAIEYNMDNMSDESILALGNILSGSKLTSSTDAEKIYSNDVYFSLGSQYIHLEFIIKKQENDEWLLTNL